MHKKISKGHIPVQTLKLTDTADNILHHQVFDNSVQPNIVSVVSTGKIILVNLAACKLLGYSRKSLLQQKRSTIFNITESGFKKMLKERTAEGHATAVVTVIKSNGKFIPCNINSAVFADRNGIMQSITTLSDLRPSLKAQQLIDNKKDKLIKDNVAEALAKSAANVKESNILLQFIGKSSYDVMWDWDLATGKINVGESFSEIFLHEMKHNTLTFNMVVRWMPGDEISRVETKLIKAFRSGQKHWDDSYMIKRGDGSMASTTSRASLVRNTSGRVVRLIGATQDISLLAESKNKLQAQISISNELKEMFMVTNRLSFDGIWEWNIITNDFFLSEGFEILFGYSIKGKTGDIKKDWTNYIDPADRAAVEKDLYSALAGEDSNWNYAYRFIKADGTIAKVFNRSAIIRGADGKPQRMIGVMHDITQQKMLEEKLAEEMNLKQMQITQATDDARDKERSDLGKELHDNVNQLLGASRLYLDMAKREGPANNDMYISRSAQYTLSAIEEIRKLTKGLTTDTIKNLGLCSAIENIARDAMEVNPVKITCSLKSFNEYTVNEKFKLNLFRIIQEEINNILKHAKATLVTIQLAAKNNRIHLTISDNGVGFNTSIKSRGIGVANIKSRAISYHGTADFVSRPGCGCVLTVVFPLSDILVFAAA
ncbi:MAG: PAS domain-containing protein [Bacteroidota bacterium]